MTYDLPESLTIGDSEYEIRSDYRACLDILDALADPELDDEERALAVLEIMYPKYKTIPFFLRQEAVGKAIWFLNGGREECKKSSARLMDWGQDFPIIVAPVNRVLGMDVRAVPYDRENNTGGLHWWTFLAAYMEIGGDCTFAQVVSIRDKLVRHKKLDKADREWLRQNRELVEFKRKYTAAEDEFIKQWI